MKAYVITIDTEITDMESMAKLASQLQEEAEAHGGKYLVRGDAISVYGGDLSPVRTTILEFDSPEQAKILLDSQRFTELRRQRSQFVKANTFMVEGV
ncbi:MAG: DUF1330 domain-containing protein [Dehalococcoidia bacterium]|nr:DUF1330 domain-containing protein [Dehalococcoidia bacterium]